MKHYKILHHSAKSGARLGVLATAHGRIKTPFFMPVATQGAVKHITSEELQKLGAQIILSNTYHLMLRPGEKAVKKFGGLHKFIGWPGLILTDSGGFQVFSLSGPAKKSGNLEDLSNPVFSGASTKKRGGEGLVKLTDKGVSFKSYIDGANFNLTPERAVKIQADLGVDIAVCLDECVALPAKHEYLEESVELTTSWARRSKTYYQRLKGNKPLLHAVIQGGLDKELRMKSLAGLTKIGFDGYNIGGLSVGETPAEMYKVLDYLVPAMPEDRPRYLMGVGYPEQIVEAVRRGVDMFDCVIPTREGRHGRLFLWRDHVIARRRTATTKQSRDCFANARNDKRAFYTTINITNSRYSADKTPISPDSKLPMLRQYSRAYLNYLFKIKEPLGARLATLNNLEFYLELMENIRQGIRSGKL
jgi:queuine tRNA-ribosyltransferase